MNLRLVGAVLSTLATACVAGVASHDAGPVEKGDVGSGKGVDTTPSGDRPGVPADVGGTPIPPAFADGGGGGPIDPNLIDCPKTPQHILIMDFRSGWWQGMGSGFGFTDVILPLIADQCPGTRVEFHHILEKLEVRCDYPPQMKCVGTYFTSGQSIVWGETDWNNYTQIWILSGSKDDLSDLPFASALFKSIADASGATCLPFFFGLGTGYVDHGNRAAEAIGLGPIAATPLPTPSNWIYDAKAVATSTMKGAALKPHVLFTGVDFLADVLTYGGKPAQGDRLIPNPNVQVIAHDNSGAPSIGVGRLPANPDLHWGRPFVIDAGAQRFYMVDKPGHGGTRRYLNNVVNYLGSVGCKSDEPPIIVP